MTAKKTTKPRTTAPTPPPEVLAIFAEAKAKAVERDGVRLGLGGQEFTLWMSRLTYSDRRRIEHHCGMGPFDVALALRGGSGHIELFAAIIAMSVFQTTRKLADMDGVVAWVEQTVLAGDVPTVDIVKFDDEASPEESEGED